jgi:hypothetical protein
MRPRHFSTRCSWGNAFFGIVTLLDRPQGLHQNRFAVGNVVVVTGSWQPIVVVVGSSSGWPDWPNFVTSLASVYEHFVPKNYRSRPNFGSTFLTLKVNSQFGRFFSPTHPVTLIKLASQLF